MSVDHSTQETSADKTPQAGAAHILGDGSNADPEGMGDNPDVLRGTQTSSSVAVDAQTNVSVWTTLGEVCGAHLRKQFRYDRNDRTWYEWRDGTHWVWIRDTTMITDDLHNGRLRIAADLGDQGRHDLRDLLANDKVWRRETGSGKGEWWAGLRRSLTRPKPSPHSYEMATPDGVVNVRTGEIEPHDPLNHDTLAVTSGTFRPQDIEYLKLTLWDRLRHSIRLTDFEQLIAILGVAVARRTVDFCSVLWLFGKSGYGKGAASDLILESLGDLGKGASSDILARISRSDIDADLAEILQVDPVVLCVSEVERVGITRLLSFTGGDTVSARRPHGPIQRGGLSGMLIATSVEAPLMPVDTGIRRRVVVIPFTKKVDESVNRNRVFSQDLLDAVVTLSIDAALQVGQIGWVPPQGDVQAKEAFLADADPVAGWLQELPDDWHGRPFQQVLEAYKRHTSEAATSTMMGRRISTSDRWTSKRDPRTGLKRIYLTDRLRSRNDR